jgi:hypothetical protein
MLTWPPLRKSKRRTEVLDGDGQILNGSSIIFTELIGNLNIR